MAEVAAFGHRIARARTCLAHCRHRSSPLQGPAQRLGGIEWGVALLADGLSDRRHEVTLFAPSGSQTEAQVVPPRGEVPPEELIGDLV
jgi:hypothetical protein